MLLSTQRTTLPPLESSEPRQRRGAPAAEATVHVAPRRCTVPASNGGASAPRARPGCTRRQHTGAAPRALAWYRLPVVPVTAQGSRRTALHCELTVGRQSAALAGGSSRQCTVS